MLMEPMREEEEPDAVCFYETTRVWSFMQLDVTFHNVMTLLKQS
jgi:hypothetical protein